MVQWLECPPLRQKVAGLILVGVARSIPGWVGSGGNQYFSHGCFSLSLKSMNKISGED